MTLQERELRREREAQGLPEPEPEDPGEPDLETLALEYRSWAHVSRTVAQLANRVTDLAAVFAAPPAKDQGKVKKHHRSWNKSFPSIGPGSWNREDDSDKAEPKPNVPSSGGAMMKALRNMGYNG